MKSFKVEMTVTVYDIDEIDPDVNDVKEMIDNIFEYAEGIEIDAICVE